MSSMSKFREFDSLSGHRPNRAWWILTISALVAFACVPFFFDISIQLSISSTFALGLLALSMGYLWGYVGILSFGQTIFFGIGAYAYAVSQINWGMSSISALLAISIASVTAGVIGWFLIYGKVGDIFFSILTLVITLVFEKLMKATSGPSYTIGVARLNGQNGIPGVPGPAGKIAGIELDSITGVYAICLIAVFLIYVALRILLTTRYGRLCVGIRENEDRMELLGCNTRAYKLSAFVIGGAVAATAGVLYVLWGGFVGPEAFGLNQAAMVVIWVLVGGKALLIGPLIGAAIMITLVAWLGVVGVGQIPLVVGLILMVVVLILPGGVVPMVYWRIRKSLGKVRPVGQLGNNNLR